MGPSAGRPPVSRIIVSVSDEQGLQEAPRCERPARSGWPNRPRLTPQTPHQAHASLLVQSISLIFGVSENVAGSNSPTVPPRVVGQDAALTHHYDLSAEGG